jgi:hypothetical protein
MKLDLLMQQTNISGDCHIVKGLIKIFKKIVLAFTVPGFKVNFCSIHQIIVEIL